MFEDNPATSLTVQTGIVDALQELEGVAGREHLLARAVDVESRGEAQSLLTAVTLLVRYHRSQEPLAAFLPGTRLPVARTAAGGLVAVAPADAFFWTAEMADAARNFAAIYAGESASSRGLWIVGEASPRFKSEAGKLGWDIHDRWQVSAPEDQTPAAAPAAGH